MARRPSGLVRPKWETPDPRGVKGSYGPAVRAWALRERGRIYGPWQQYSMDRALRYDRHGDIIARVILWGVGRQNGKTVNVEDIVGWMLDEGRKLEPFAGWTEMLAAAHDAPQARKMYNRVRAGIEGNKALAERVRATQWAGIRAGPLDFNTVTGQADSARGSAAGLVAWDEVLTQKDHTMWSVLKPAQSAQRSPIMLLTSTAGHADSVLLRTFYDRLVRIASGAEEPDPRFYAAWWESDDPDAGALTAQTAVKLTEAEWLEVRKANPALGDGRLTREAIEDDHKTLPPDHWRRERLNHFVDVRVPGAFNPATWAACRVPRPLDGLLGPYALGVDVQPGWERATIVASAIRKDGRVGAEVYRDLRATEGEPITAERIIAEVERFPEPVKIVAYDGVSGAAPAFRRHEQETGYPWDELAPRAIVAACMDVTEMIQAARLAVDDPLIDAQIAWTARRPVGQDGLFRFSRRTSLGAIDAVYAMTLAAHAIAYTPPLNIHV